MSEQNRTWVHPNAISYEYEHDGEKSKLHYFRSWRRLDFTLENYTVTRHVLGQNTNAEIDDPVFDEAAEKVGEQGYDSLSDEEKRAFADHQLSYVQTYEEGGNLRLIGWAQIEKASITAFSVKEKGKIGNPDKDVLVGLKDNDYENYEKTFRRAKIQLTSHPEDLPGALLLWTTDLQQYGSDHGDPDEDFLLAELYMEKSKLVQVVEELSGMSEKPALTIHSQALLFQNEVDESLSEPWHRQEYAFIHDTAEPMIVDRLTYRLIETDRRLRDTDEHDVIGYGEPAVDDELTKPPVQPDQKTFEPVGGDIAGQMRGVKRAIWILAAAIILAAMISG